MTALDVVYFACPGISEGEADALLWGATGFPCFIHKQGHETPVQSLWREVWHAARIWRRGWLHEYIEACWTMPRAAAPEQETTP